MADLWLRTSLPSDVLVLTINPGSLAETDRYARDPQEDDLFVKPKKLIAHLVARQWGVASGDFKRLFLTGPNWIFPYRFRVNDRIKYETLMARIALCDFVGSGVYAAFPPTKNPWVVERPAYAQIPHIAEVAYATHLANFRRRGWFDAESYYLDSESTQILIRLIKKVYARKTSVVIVVLPESSRIHKMIPREAETMMRATLEQAFGREAPPVLDLRKSMDDDLFFDTIHLDAEGQRKFTSLLSRELAPHLPAKNRSSP